MTLNLLLAPRLGWTAHCATLALVTAFGFASPARAAIDDMDDDEVEGGDEAAPSADEGGTAEPEEGDADAKSEAPGAAATGTALAADAWDRDALQFEAGARGRVMVVPKFLINAFGVEGGADLVVGGVGAEAGISQGPFEGLLGIWYAGYNTGQIPFKGPTDPPQGWEMIQSNLGMLYITADLMFRGKIARDWQWFVGGGLGVGIVTGTLKRNETYWSTPGGVAGDPYTQLALCSGPGMSAPGVPNTLECPGPIDANNRYDIVTGQSSDAWPVYPWLTYQMGVRYQPVKNFIARLDLGAGSSGFWFGIGADYGL
jgi:hypothetical protein